MPPSTLITAIEDKLMPLRCVFCGTRAREGERSICRACLEDLPWTGAPDMPVTAGLACVIAPLAYEFPVDAAIRAFKFRRKLYYGPAFAELLCAASVHLPRDVDAVLAVPLHWRRKWLRGFNQALEIARPLARHLGLPVIHNVRRCRATPSQSGLSAAQRRRNLRAAFAVRGSLPHRHVLIVDDVITTGSTMQRVAGVLAEAGVPNVSGMAAACVRPGGTCNATRCR